MFHRKIFYKYATRYFSQSSIHCFKQLVDKNRSNRERICWITLVIMALLGAFVISYESLQKYIENPTVISIDKDRYVWNTSFPSITVCPLSKINTTFLEDYINCSVAENKTLLKEFLINLAYADYGNLDKIPQYDEIPGEDYAQLLLDLQNDFTPSISNTGSINISFIVYRVVTEMGICYSFNSKLAIYNAPE